MIDGDEQTLSSGHFPNVTDELGMVGEPCLIRQVVAKIAFVKNDPRRLQIAKQRAICRIERRRRT